MKKQFRILAAALALCLSLLCCPAAFAAVDSSNFCFNLYICQKVGIQSKALFETENKAIRGTVDFTEHSFGIGDMINRCHLFS